ncbi:MAG: hypothetical protein K0R62_6144, partial [Nonomuraea muscovyensis]|nr:hypothetical protein [Nonomuraea muscovyensis]
DMLLWRVLSGAGEALQLAAIITVASSAFPARRDALLRRAAAAGDWHLPPVDADTPAGQRPATIAQERSRP